ncbi:MAG: hypothetical protein COB62_00145 [Piscirickettsiaceae bacterium]|nr:MAG: hypothetical protein COB62_00145 [Piscirickettsiaceae bacterium]
MRWRGRRSSSNLEDQRNMQIRGGAAGGGMLRLLPIVFKFLGFKGTAIVAAGFLGYGLLTGNLSGMLGLQQNAPATSSNKPLQQSTEEKELAKFVGVILADTEETWQSLFSQMGKVYKEPKLILFRDRVNSACGLGQAAMGPFYCPADQKVYIDLGFYEQLKNKFNAPGDFAQAYVIAHEVGHHVQTLLGVSASVQKAKQGLSKKDANKLSVKQELQADCFAGIWAYHAGNVRQLLEDGDIEEGLTAASAIGDDTLQRQAGGTVSPDSFTHGSAVQRVKWFKTGLSKGKISVCDTFK